MGRVSTVITHTPISSPTFGNALIADYLSQTDANAQSIASKVTFTGTTSGAVKLAPSYTIYKVDTTYYAMAEDGTVTSNAAIHTFINALFVSSGGNCNFFFKKATYNLTGSIAVTNIDNVTLAFENGATLFVGNGMNAPAIFLNNANNWLIQGVTIDGNAINQVLGSNNVQGIQFESCKNCRIDGANIYNVRRFGVYIYDVGSVNDGVTNSKITNCGWNGITLGYGVETALYAINNEVSHCGDWGITSYGYYSMVQNNYVHDIDGITGFGTDNSGIGIEGGGNSSVIGNTIVNTGNPAIGVYGNDCFVFRNFITEPATFTIGTGIRVFGNYNHVTSNTINMLDDDTGGPDHIGIANGATGNIIEQNEIIGGYGAGGIHASGGAVNTVIKNNDFRQCTNYYNIWNQGTATSIYTNPGYNPVGYIANPILSGGSNLLDKLGDGATFVSTTVYTNVGSPKTLYITGGTVTVIAHNGQTVATIATTMSLNLQPTDTFSATFTVAPTIKVFGQ